MLPGWIAGLICAYGVVMFLLDRDNKDHLEYWAQPNKRFSNAVMSVWLHERGRELEKHHDPGKPPRKPH